MIPKAWMLSKICILCELDHRGKHAVCADCLSSFPGIPFACTSCGLPVNKDLNICGLCIKTPPATSQIISPYSFTEPLRSLIHQYKYNGGFYLSSSLSYLLWKCISSSITPDILIPMPMHPKRIRERGFNHTILLTKHLSNWLKIPYDMNICKKTKYTISQASLPAKERKNNLTHTFATLNHNYKYIVIIDDVYTTGSTVQALATKLKASGALRVDAWCIARTCPD